MDPATRAIAQNLRCADLAQSCLFGTESNQIATLALQNEWSSRGYSDTLLGDIVAEDGKVIPGGKTVRARMGFLDFGAFAESGPTAAGARAQSDKTMPICTQTARCGWTECAPRKSRMRCYLSI